MEFQQMLCNSWVVSTPRRVLFSALYPLYIYIWMNLFFVASIFDDFTEIVGFPPSFFFFFFQCLPCRQERVGLRRGMVITAVNGRNKRWSIGKSVPTSGNADTELKRHDAELGKARSWREQEIVVEIVACLLLMMYDMQQVSFWPD